MPVIAAFCPACSEVRAQTAELPRGHVPAPEEFTPVHGQEQPVKGSMAICTACQTGLVFRRLPEQNGHHSESVSHPQYEPLPAGPAVTTHFEVGPGEEVKSMQPHGRKILVLTNKRVVTIDLDRLAED